MPHFSGRVTLNFRIAYHKSLNGRRIIMQRKTLSECSRLFFRSRLDNLGSKFPENLGPLYALTNQQISKISKQWMMSHILVLSFGSRVNSWVWGVSRCLGLSGDLTPKLLYLCKELTSVHIFPQLLAANHIYFKFFLHIVLCAYKLVIWECECN